MLESLFSPASVAVAGASSQPGKLGNIVLRKIIDFGYPGDLYPINPRADEILGLRAYPRVSDVPGPVDLVVITVAPNAVADVMLDAARAGAKAAVVLTAGFREVGPEGAAEERKIADIAREAGMRLMGPNCVGVLDTESRLNATFLRGSAWPGNIGFLSQSGALGTAMLDWAEQVGIGFSKFASLGNKADITEVDVLEAWADDPRTRVIIAYLESITDGPRFMEVASRLTKVKPVIVVKGGSTASGARAASSHTGALAGADAAYDAAFKQCGVIRCHSMAELFELSMAFAHQPPPKGDRVGIVTNAGGPGVLASDAVDRYGLRLASLSPETVAALRGCLPPTANVHNPVDVIGDADPARYRAALDLVLADPGVDSVVAIFGPQGVTEPYGVAETIVEAAHTTDKPIIGEFEGGSSVDRVEAILREGGVPNYRFPEQAVSVIRGLGRYRAWQGRAVEMPVEFDRDRETVARLIAEARAEGQVNLADAKAREALAAYGLRVPMSQVVRSAEEALAAAERIGCPVAMKIVSADILHKTDAGCVRLGVANADGVRQAHSDILENARLYAPEAVIEGITVQEMLKPGKEVIIGITRDPQFGPLLMFGLGGIYVEVLKDVAFRVAPLTRLDAEEMVREIRAFPLLAGVRGEKPSDLSAVTDALLRTAQLANDFPEIAEMDINPLMVYEEGQGAVAVDGRIILSAAN